MNPKNQRSRIMESKKLENIFTKQDSSSQKEPPFTSEDVEKIKTEIKRLRKNDSNVRYITDTEQKVEPLNSGSLHDSIFAELKSLKDEIKKITEDIGLYQIIS